MARYKSTKPLDRLVRAATVANDYEEAAEACTGEVEAGRTAKKWTAGMARSFRHHFARKLKALREQSGLSLHALAEKAEVDHSQLVRLESAERSCTLETAVKIAAALGVSLGLLTDKRPTI
jgi:ribosome-binding protein aMBF1 (putative translation factor)